MFRLKKQAQSTAEYAIVIALVIGAVVAMQVYVKRGLQGRMKGAVDNYLVGKTSTDPGDGSEFIPTTTTGGLYEPQELTRELEQTRSGPNYEIVRKDAGIEGQVERGIGTASVDGGGVPSKVDDVTQMEKTTVTPDVGYEKYDYTP
jgi:hypothetical protein